MQVARKLAAEVVELRVRANSPKTATIMKTMVLTMEMALARILTISI
jgi:hypothetical protein